MYWVFQLQDIHWWNWMPVHFQILRWIFQLFQSQVQNKNSLLLKINCKVISFMTVSNFMVCWCCTHIIPWLYEKEYTSTHEYADPSCTSAACAWNKSTKKEIEPKQITGMVVRTCIYIICTFRYSFIGTIYGQYLYLIFGGSQSVWGRSSCQKWVSDWQGSWDIGISLIDVVTQCKQVFRFPADLYGFS